MTDPGTAKLRILVPLDGSARARAALTFVGKLDFASLTLLHVVVDNTAIIPGTVVEDEHDFEARRRDLEESAAPFRTGNRTVQVEVRAGEPAREIIDAGRDVDLIVMTTRGRGLAARAFFGSVADQVSRESGAPTAMIRDERQIAAQPVRIVTPLDGSPIGETAIPTAILMARACACPVHLMRAVDVDDVRAAIRAQRASGESDQTYEEARVQAEQDARAYLEARQREIEAAGIECDIQILNGTPSFVLLWEIQETDLVVMSSHGRSGYKRWLTGSVAEKMVREAKAPVVIVPDPTLDD